MSEIEYRPLGAAGFSVSTFSLGTMVFGWKTPEDEAFRMLDFAANCGINLIDTSNSYGRGASEEMIGRWRRQSTQGSKMLLATKFHYWSEGDDPSFSQDTRKHIIQQCEASLLRLRTDRIDLFQLHRPRASERIGDTLATLGELIDAGKVRAIGASGFSSRQMREAQGVAVELGLRKFASEQTPLNLLDRSTEVELLPTVREFGMGGLIWSPLAEGILTGKYVRNQPLPSNSRFAWVTKPGLYASRLNDQVFDVIERLERLAESKGCKLSHLALAWCRNHPSVSSVLLGPSTIEQLEQNLISLDVKLDEKDLTEIDAIVPPFGYLTPYYFIDKAQGE